MLQALTSLLQLIPIGNYCVPGHKVLQFVSVVGSESPYEPIRGSSWPHPESDRRGSTHEQHVQHGLHHQTTGPLHTGRVRLPPHSTHRLHGGPGDSRCLLLCGPREGHDRGEKGEVCGLRRLRLCGSRYDTQHVHVNLRGVVDIGGSHQDY